MKSKSEFDAVVVGSGPNGLAAAITLAEAGHSVVVYEASNTVGGGTRSAELTIPGYVHDVCSAIHPLGLASPFFRQLKLENEGLEWIHPELPLAHPFDDGTAAALHRSIEDTGRTLGSDSNKYLKQMRPLVANWDKLLSEFLGPLRLPRHPLLMARFGLLAIQPASFLAKRTYSGHRGRGFFAGLAAHSIMTLKKPATAAFGLMLGMLGHAVGWPLPKGGSQSIATGLARRLESLGGQIVTGFRVESLDQLPESRAILFDVTPKQLLRITGERFPNRYRRALNRYRYGPGVYKIDLALDGPVPWQAEPCRQAGTVHVGGSLEEIVASEEAVWRGNHHEKPFVLVAQQSLFDDTRAPGGKHTIWAYCHVPNGSTKDMTEPILRQIERFAPGFRDLILASHTYSATELQSYNPNYIGGDINGGVQDLTQLFTRPVIRPVPYTTPDPKIYLCSSSTPPGGGVHGMCGYFAAQAVLKRVFK